MNQYVLGLAGAAGAGKDTVARMIVEERSDWIVVVDHFADRLKISAARALGLQGDHQELIEQMDALKGCGRVITIIEHGQYDVQEVDVSGREFLQLYGTESHRDVFGSDFWVDQVLPYPSEANCWRDGQFDLLVIPDVRFPNEVERIRTCGGEVWLITGGRSGKITGHQSERVVEHTTIIENTGTLERLRDEVRREMTMIGL